jgi:Thioesterase-like superfamily/2,4-diaminopentanoate dehydrogenase C-terminal domain
VPDLWTDLLTCLDPHPVPSGGTGGERSGENVTEFEGRNQQLEYHRVFGGQLLGQFIRIASATCPDKAVKSQHVVFTREGRADEPIRYQATRHHEGRSFATVTITARQSRGVVATSAICMHAHEDGPERQTVDEVPASGELAMASRETAIAAGTLAAGSVAAQRITISGSRAGLPMLQFPAMWYCTTELDPAWEVRETGWHVSVDGDAPLDVTLRMPVPLDRMAAVSPAYTANRAVNAVPYVCAAAPGIHSSVDLPQVVTSLG